MLGGFEAAYGSLYPNWQCFIVASVYELAQKEFAWTLEFLAQFPFRGKKLIDYYHVTSAARGSNSIRSPWGSCIMTRSADKPASLLGAELDMIVLGEASQLPRVVWERFLRARIGPRRGGMLALSTPNADSGLFAEFYKKGQDKEEVDWESWQFSILGNPTFSKVEYETARGELDEKIFKEQYQGQFVSYRGRVFPTFNSQVHIINTLPEELEQFPVLIGIQPGFQNPFVVLWVAVDQTNLILYVFDEMHEEHVLIPELAKEIRDRSAGMRIMTAVTDCFTPITIEELKKHALPVTSNESVEAKKGAASSKMKRVQVIQNALKIINGKPKIYIHKKCKALIRELRACKWPSPPKEGTEQKLLEKPLTKFFQAPQALAHILIFLGFSGGI